MKKIQFASVNFRYSDNSETHHFIPIFGALLSNFLHSILAALVSLFTLTAVLNCASKSHPDFNEKVDHPILNDLKAREKVVPVNPDQNRNPANDDLPGHSSDDVAVKNAICREQYEKGTPSVFYYFKSLKQKGWEPSEVEIAGIKFVNENPELLEAFLLLMSPAEANPELSAVNSKLRIDPSCQKVLCATQEIFGNHVGPKMLYLMHKFSLNTSPYSWQNADTFTDGELVDIIRGLELVPFKHIPTGHNRKFIRFKRGYKRVSSSNSVVANASFEFFDLFEELSSEERQYAVLHEFGHNFGDTVLSNMDISDEWMKLGGWKKLSPREYQIYAEANRKGHSFVSRYAQAAPWEDFAETVSAYRLRPKWLKERSEGKFNFIKAMVFDGVSFESEKTCKQERISSTLLSSIEKIEKQFTPEDIQKISGFCRAQVDTAFFGFLPTSFINKCINIEATLMWNEKNPRQFKAIVPNGLFQVDYRASRLNFPKIQSQVKETYVTAISEAIKSAVNSTNLVQMTDVPTTEYCEKFTENSSAFFNINHESTMRNFDATKDKYESLKVSKNKVYGLCLNLYEGYTPKGTGQGIVAYLKSLVTAKPEYKSRGLSDEKIQSYVRDYLKY